MPPNTEDARFVLVGKPWFLLKPGPLFRNVHLLRTLQQLEVELHQVETRRNTARLEALLHPAFEEFGRSGRRYSRSAVIAEFQGEKSELAAVHAQDFQLAELGAGVALLTYRSAHVDAAGCYYRWTLRSSLWLYTEEGWRIRFHQGTPEETIQSTTHE